MRAMTAASQYRSYSYLVDLGRGIAAGFAGATGLPVKSALDDAHATPHESHGWRMPGMLKFTNISLHFGLVSAKDFYDWVSGVRDGTDARRMVTIHRSDEPSKKIIATWQLSNAWPSKWTGPDFNAKGADVAMEELVLSCEGIQMVCPPS